MKTIYIIEPDIILANIYADTLSSDGFNCMIFRSARLALKALDIYMPDLIILELALPVHNGFEFLYELRSYSDTKKVKVIVNSFLKYDPSNWEFVKLEDFGIVSYLDKQSTNQERLALVVRGQMQ